jgi:hypothetical protein
MVSSHRNQVFAALYEHSFFFGDYIYNSIHEKGLHLFIFSEKNMICNFIDRAPYCKRDDNERIRTLVILYMLSHRDMPICANAPDMSRHMFNMRYAAIRVGHRRHCVGPGQQSSGALDTQSTCVQSYLTFSVCRVGCMYMSVCVCAHTHTVF